MKIDRSFVKDLPGDESSCAIIAAIIAMSHALHKSVLAEGVAEPEQLVYLRRLGCDMIQGFDLSRPLCATDLEVFMRTAAAAPTAQAA